MAITNSFRKAVEDGDVKDIRIILKESLLVDPTFAEFEEKSRYARAVSGVYISHDGRELVADKSSWNDDYMDKLMSQLVTNFSRERVNHLKEVVRHLRPVSNRPQPQSTTSQPHSNYQEQKRQDQRNGNFRGAKIAAGAVIGGAVGGTIAGVAGGSFIIGVAIGAVVVSAVVAIATNGE